MLLPMLLYIKNMRGLDKLTVNALPTTCQLLADVRGKNSYYEILVFGRNNFKIRISLCDDLHRDSKRALYVFSTLLNFRYAGYMQI